MDIDNLESKERQSCKDTNAAREMFMTVGKTPAKKNNLFCMAEVGAGLRIRGINIIIAQLNPCIQV